MTTWGAIHELEARVKALEEGMSNLQAELIQARTEAAARLEERDEARRERDAYKKAKQENDERFMCERDEARNERNAARAEIANLTEQYERKLAEVQAAAAAMRADLEETLPYAPEYFREKWELGSSLKSDAGRQLLESHAAKLAERDCTIADLQRVTRVYNCPQCGYHMTTNDDARALEEKVAERDREIERLRGSEYSLAHYKDIWDMACEHVAEACEMLGAEREKEPCDTWKLRELCQRSVADVARLRVTIAERDKEIERLRLECVAADEGLMRRPTVSKIMSDLEAANALVAERDAQLERVMADIQMFKASLDDVSAQLAERDREIERLRAQLGVARDTQEVLSADVARLTAELAAEREAHVATRKELSEAFSMARFSYTIAMRGQSVKARGMLRARFGRFNKEAPTGAELFAEFKRTNQEKRDEQHHNWDVVVAQRDAAIDRAETAERDLAAHKAALATVIEDCAKAGDAYQALAIATAEKCTFGASRNMWGERSIGGAHVAQDIRTMSPRDLVQRAAEERQHLKDQLDGMTGERDNEREIAQQWERRAETAEATLARAHEALHAAHGWAMSPAAAEAVRAALADPAGQSAHAEWQRMQRAVAAADAFANAFDQYITKMSDPEFVVRLTFLTTARAMCNGYRAARTPAPAPDGGK